MRQALDWMGKHWLWLALGLVVIQVLAVVAMGRPWICPCGFVLLWAEGGITGDSSQHIADWYTPSHVLHGVLFYALLRWVGEKRGWKLNVAAMFVAAVALEAGWEIFENTPWVIEHYRAKTAAVDYMGDTIVNSFFDTVWMALGFVMAWRLPVAWVVAVAIVFELVALLAVRDNLFLNVMTFIWPAESVVEWQGEAQDGISGQYTDKTP